jgi:heparosan-N-sulfate-glucuronate 5-epimerase
MSATAKPSRRSDAGFWSSSSSFFLPVGPRIDPDGVRGYPIDLRIKAQDADGLQPDPGPNILYVGLTQYALGCFERWLAEGDERWLHAASATAERLLDAQDRDGSWYHYAPFPHTFPLRPPWASGISQGQAASLFTRLYLETGEERLAEAAVLALAPLTTPQRDGGVGGELGGRPWPEEYPTSPQSHVLNGAIFALWGMRDVAVGLSNDKAGRDFREGIDSLLANLHRYDTGSWSLYALFPHPILNRASSFYHDLHVNQFAAMEQLAPHPEFGTTRRRWAAYADSRYDQAKAFAWKAAFRLLVPRNRRFARLAPWTR